MRAAFVVVSSSCLLACGGSSTEPARSEPPVRIEAPAEQGSSEPGVGAGHAAPRRVEATQTPSPHDPSTPRAVPEGPPVPPPPVEPPAF